MNLNKPPINHKDLAEPKVGAPLRVPPPPARASDSAERATLQLTPNSRATMWTVRATWWTVRARHAH
eukprot:1194702-Prorocentrum_minimum.AAC.5